MKFNIRYWGICIVCVLFLSTINCFGSRKNNDRLVIAISTNNPPYEFIQYGNIVGFDIDLINIICERLNKNYVLHDVSSDILLSEVKSKKCDMAISAINMSHPEKFSVDFSIPYQTNTKAIVVVNTGEFRNVQQGAYLPLSFLNGKIIGVQIGSSSEESLYKKNIKGSNVRHFNSLKELKSAITKNIDNTWGLYGIIVSIPEAQSIVAENKNLIFYQLKLDESLVIAFPKGSPLIAPVNEIISTLIRENKISELELKWDMNL